jgi:site-specific recombinase XerD
MRETFNIIFFPRKTRSNKNGTIPVYARITINGERLVMATNVSIQPGKWSKRNGCVAGNSEDAQRTNSYLETFRKQIFDHYSAMLKREIPVNPVSLKKQILGIQDDQRSILEVFAKHNEQVEARVGHEYAKATALKFRSTLKHIREYIAYRYKRGDLSLSQIDHSFVTEFEYYLKNVKNCNHNSALKYVKLFRKIVRHCLAHGWMERDPFAGYKSKVKHVERDFLTTQELTRIENLVFTMPRLELVRDIFVFSCYTGVAYIDISKLAKENLIEDEEGGLWVSMIRTKTQTRFQIPLLPKALEIVKKYESHPVSVNRNRLLPTFYNQKMNAYLKEIAHLADVKKHLTFHVARHTFSTTVTLTNGVPIETVSAMLGHKNIRTTQIYARILKEKIGVDMKVLREKLEKRE